MYHSIFKRCVTDQPIQFKPLIHIVGDFVFYDVTVKSNHIAVVERQLHTTAIQIERPS